MPKPFYGDESPIVALATPPGESALALIRSSGPGSVALLSRVFSRPATLRKAAGNSVVYGWIRRPRDAVSRKTGTRAWELIDEVLVSVYRAPRSYTGEEGADITCHGGTATVRAVLETLEAAGFRESLPGEFSFRAFMNGKLDLTRSESVMELVRAKTGAARERAADRLAGRLQGDIAVMNRRLVEALAETELHLDYDEEELGLSGEGLPGRELVEDTLQCLRNLAGSWPGERLYQEGALAVIAGRPNAGKSSLFNALLGEDRSIVTAVPGTTRDWIEALVNIRGIPLRLVDTAGLREDLQGPPPSAAEEGGGLDRAEEIGIQRSRELLDRADLVLYVIDGTQGLRDEDKALLRTHAALPHPLILLWNKADIAPPPESLLPEFLPPESLPPEPLPPEQVPSLPLSATTGEGLEQLCGAIETALKGGIPRRGSETGLGSRRQKELVDRACTALEEVLSLAGRGEPLDLLAPLLREAVNALGEITGEVSTADILEAIFSKFCVGK
ncbi:MAG: tRNA uridine-5-carboxymethylaminomethyl(34) synthesis GTPase MnmE [Treponema sp.]|jgi:tRNA modification GTPase|nr:tRNA uridine-5-carboxymethylaminomethyl(34) synthesis GTPase MnmE [Treponema sp.]